MNDQTHIKDEGHEVDYDPQSGVVKMTGVMRLNGLQEYASITALLSNAIQERDSLTLDLTQLEFLNSSGIAMLSKFIIEARKSSGLQLTVQGSKSVAWQSKSLVNLKRLMPNLELNFV